MEKSDSEDDNGVFTFIFHINRSTILGSDELSRNIQMQEHCSLLQASRS